MIAHWNSNQIRLRYPLPLSPIQSDLYQDTKIPDFANEAVISNLALRLAPMLGKQVPPDTRINARRSFNEVVRIFSKPVDKDDVISQPLIGAGDKYWRNDGYVNTSNATKINTDTGSFLEFS